MSYRQCMKERRLPPDFYRGFPWRECNETPADRLLRLFIKNADLKFQADSA